MPSPPRRARFQIHLSTAIVLMFAAGLLIWANVRERIQIITSTYSMGTQRVNFVVWTHGWPFPAYAHSADDFKVPVGIPRFLNADESQLNSICIAGDALTAILLILVVWFTCEWLIRRRAARKKD